MELSSLKVILPDVDDAVLEGYLATLQELGVKTKEDVIVLDVDRMKPIPFCHAQRVLNHYNTMETPSSAVRRKRPLEESQLSNFTFPLEKVPTHLSAVLSNGQTFTNDARRSFVNFVAGEISHINASPSKAVVDKIARDIVQKWPSSFILQDSKGNALHTNSANALSQFLRNRLKNEFSKGKKAKKELFPGDKIEPAIDDEEELEKIRNDLKSQHHQHNHRDDSPTTETVGLMKRTYPLRRKNVKNLNNQQVLGDWPCLFSSLIILDHEFEKLTGTKVEIELGTARRIVEHIKSKLKYKKLVNDTNVQLESVIGREETMVPYQSYVYLFLIKVFQDSEENIYRVFPEETSMGDVLNAVRLPTPMVVVIGGDIFQPQKVAIVFEGTFLMLPLTNFSEAMHAAFKVYHVLVLKYAEKTENYWQFFELYLAGGVHSSGKQSRKQKVLTFVAELCAANK